MCFLPLVMCLVLQDKVRTQETRSFVIPSAALHLYDSLREHTLSNGLKVYLLPVPGSPIVTMMTCFKVGACDEDKNATGLSHYLEHLLFKGTARFKPGDIDRMTQRSGGSNNAYTNHDITNYHFDFAADRWETGLEIEAERMRGTLIDKQHEFEQEKGAVIEELARNEDTPWDLEEKAMLQLLFGKESPYGHPVIGEREHVRSATAPLITTYYNNWYHPNNAAVVLVGGFDPDIALAKIKSKLESIPSAKLPERHKWTAITPTKQLRHEFTSKFPVPRMVMAFVTIPQGHEDETALDMASMVLASGKTSRLYKKLVLEERIALDVSASHLPGRNPGWLNIQVELIPGKERAQAEKLIVHELNRLATETVSAEEMTRYQRLLITQTIFSRESIHSLADSIASSIHMIPVSKLKNQFSLWAIVKPQDIQRVAQQYLLQDKSVIVWSVPKAEPSLGSVGSAVKPERRSHTQSEGGRSPVNLQQTKKVVLPNGLTLLMLQNSRMPIVVAATSLKYVREYEDAAQSGLALLTGSLLEEGTEQRTQNQIAETIENVGGSLSLSSGGGVVKVLKDNSKLGLDLLFDCLLHSNFPGEAFARKKEEQKSEIAQANEEPLSRAFMAFQESVYGTHFKGRVSRGTLQSVEQLTREDCLQFHRKIMTPENLTIAVVGDFDYEEVTNHIKSLTAKWDSKLQLLNAQPEIAFTKEGSTRIITMPQAAQLQFLMGHLGITRDNPDYFKLLVMDNVLGTGSGFTDRLSSRLRDREGLAYTVTATITDSADLQPGTFMCYIGTDARNYQRVKQLFLEEIERLQKEVPSEYEVTSTKQYLIGKLAFLMTTNESIAQRLLYLNRFGFGLDYYDRYKNSVESVTPEQIREMAKKYIHTGKFTTIAAGAIDQQGKVLPPKAEK
ncbi:MAG: insulinase family protein [Planctomycetia bacterium]|nr:insulinase family protein [Planctomycetia bacterium]